MKGNGNGHIDPLQYVRAYRERSLGVFARLADDQVAALIQILTTARREHRHVFTCGNGGSAATASHFASGLGKDGSWGREEKFRALSLTDNVAWLTSLANDSDYSQIFVEQLKNFAQPDDVLIAFSASGNSPNVLRAVEWANQHGLLTVGITGKPGGQLTNLARQVVSVDTDHTGHVEEAHFLIQHLVSYYFIESQ
jgi:D-sedoheptulose 7-phosphate isomerase